MLSRKVPGVKSGVRKGFFKFGNGAGLEEHLKKKSKVIPQEIKQSIEQSFLLAGDTASSADVIFNGENLKIRKLKLGDLEGLLWVGLSWAERAFKWGRVLARLASEHGLNINDPLTEVSIISRLREQGKLQDQIDCGDGSKISYPEYTELDSAFRMICYARAAGKPDNYFNEIEVGVEQQDEWNSIISAFNRVNDLQSIGSFFLKRFLRELGAMAAKGLR